MLRPDAAILSAAPVKGVALLAGETPVGATPDGAAVPTGGDGMVLLTKIGSPTEAVDAIGAAEGAIGEGTTGAELIAAADGDGVTLTAGAALVAASAGEETGAGLETTGAAAGELDTGAAAGVELVTGLVRVQGQFVIVKVVAWVQDLRQSRVPDCQDCGKQEIAVLAHWDLQLTSVTT